MADLQPPSPSASTGHPPAEPCTECGAGADPEGGLRCATCGQWQVLCPSCTRRVPGHARDAAWSCPACRDAARQGAL